MEHVHRFDEEGLCDCGTSVWDLLEAADARVALCEALLAEVINENLDGAGFWDARARKALGWPRYPEKIKLYTGSLA